MFHLLLIDDEEDLTEVTGSYLRNQGFEVETCNEPTQALGRLRSRRYDAVVVDLMMFPMDGISILRGLRELADYARSPIFVISAKILSDEERKELLALGVHFIPKPFHPRLLAERLREEIPPA